MSVCENIIINSDQEKTDYIKYKNRLKKLLSKRKISKKQNITDNVKKLNMSSYQAIDNVILKLKTEVNDLYNKLITLQSVLFYKEKVDDSERSEYEQLKADYLKKTQELDNIILIKQEKYKSYEDKISEYKEKILLLKDELRELFLTMKNTDSTLMKSQTDQYFNKKKEINTIKAQLKNELENRMCPIFILNNIGKLPKTKIQSKKRKSKTLSKKRKSKTLSKTSSIN